MCPKDMEDDPPATIHLDRATADLIRDICERWNRVEGLLKRAERLRNQAIIPSINELRYAGRNIIDALNILVNKSDQPWQDVFPEFKSFIIEAQVCCRKAEHDIVDAMVFYLHGKMKNMREEFGFANIQRFFPEFVKFTTQMAEINAFITQSREEREKRPEIYQKILVEYLPDLEKWHKELEVSHEAMREELPKEKRARQIGKVIMWVSLFLAFASITITLAAVL